MLNIDQPTAEDINKDFESAGKSVDLINGIVAGVSGEYRNEHCLIIHQRLNDAKESGGRKVFSNVEILEAEKKRLGIIEPDHRVATTLILRQHLDLIREFRNSSAYQTNMNRLAAARNLMENSIS